MSRNNTEVALSSSSSSPKLSASEKNVSGPHRPAASSVGEWTARAVFLISVAALAAAWRPFGLANPTAAGGGFLAALLLLLAELRLRRAEISGLLGGAAGTIAGVFAALLATLVISRTAISEPTKSF